MKSITGRALLFTLALGISVVCAYADEKSDRKEIQALFDKAVQLLGKKDVDGLVKLTDPKATFSLPDGTKLTVKQWADTTKTASSATLSLSSDTSKIVSSEPGATSFGNTPATRAASSGSCAKNGR